MAAPKSENVACLYVHIRAMESIRNMMNVIGDW